MTSSGKPPLDDEPLDSSWDLGSGGTTEGDGLGVDPPTPRVPQGPPAVQGSAPAAEGEANAEGVDTRPIFGAGVPYGGDDHTEEIDPIALDAPFTAEERKGPLLAVAPTPPPDAHSAPPRMAPSESMRDFELKAPMAQMVLSDLFDSTPSTGSMAPPDPAAFSSSRPPHVERSASEAAVSSSSAVVALPSIDIVGDASAAAPKPANPSVSRSPANSAAAAPSAGATPKHRQSVPTLESVVTATSKNASGKASASKKSSPQPAVAKDATSVAAEEPPRFPSDVPTTRPPDVALAPTPASSPSIRPATRNNTQPNEARAPQLAIAAPPPSTQTGKVALPSIILAKDVEAEPDSTTRRAMRAARATVRIELPPNFGQPGSAFPPSTPRAAAPGAPSHAWGAVRPAIPAVAALAWMRSRKTVWLMAAGLLLPALLVLALTPRSGSLVVTALGPGNRAVENVQIFVDGKPLCDVSPCRIKGLSAGVHTLRATAPDLASQAEETVEISAGDEATYNIDLLAAEPAVKAGGLRIAAAESELTLYIDGKRVGKLPQTVSGLPGGRHWIKLDPEDDSAPIEKSVTILPGEIVDVDARAHQREKATVRIRLSPGSEGASVTLDDAFLLDFPAELELEPNSVHTLSATKPGYEDFSMDVRVEEGESEKLIELALTPLDGATPARKAKAKTVRKAAPKALSASGDATEGLLNISSVPPSQIILNGRPLGNTPKTGIAVPGDSLQTIVFVHPKMGRRRAQKFVPAGKERTVSIRF